MRRQGKNHSSALQGLPGNRRRPQAQNHPGQHPRRHRPWPDHLYPGTFAQAVLGAELEIPTIDGKVKYDLPEGTQSGTTFRLKGKGIPTINGRGRGDQYVTVYIETPRNLNKEQKEALKRFAESVGDGNYEERKKFFKKFKK